MLFDIIGDIAVGLILVAVVASVACERTALPSRAMRRRWRRETAGPHRP